MPEDTQIVVATLTMFVGSIVVTTVGFGLGITTSPVLLLTLDPQTVVVMVVSVGTGVFAIVAFQSRSFIPAREIAPIGIAGLAGVALGVFVLNSAGASALRIGISVLILLTAVAAVFNLGASLGRVGYLGPPWGLRWAR